MKKLLLLLFIVIVSLLASPLYSTPYSPKTINLHSPLYEETDILYRLHGLALPSGARPWSTDEAALILSVIPDGGKTAELKQLALSRLETTLLKQDSNGLSHRLSTTISLEGYAHTNTTQFILPQDWSYSIDRRLPLFDFRMELQWNEIFYFSTSMEIGASATRTGDQEKNFTQGHTDGVGAIIPANNATFEFLTFATLFQQRFNTNLLDFSKNINDVWPNDSQITLGGAWWNLSLGRGPLSWGVGQSGNLIIGDHINSHNNLNISFFSEEFKLQLLYLFLPNPLDDATAQRVFMGHRLETQPYPWMRFTVTENVMFKGASIPLSYIDPTYIYHNYYNTDMLNSLAGLELHMAVIPGLSFYAQFALDQFQFSNEGGSEANAMGLLVGLTHSALLQKGVLSTTIEAVATDPSLYRRNNVDFLLIRGLKFNSNPMQFDYLGYKWGSDSVALSAEIAFLIPGKARYAANALIHRQGEVTIFGVHSESAGNTGNSDIKGPPPSGNEMTDQIIIGLEGSWWLQNAPIRFFTDLTWIGRRTYDTNTKISSGKKGDLQLVAGAVYTF